MTRAVLVCPGRGSYTERSLGSLPAGHPWVRRTDELRATFGLPSVSELDSAERFSGAVHMRPANVSALIWLVTMLDAEAARSESDVTCVVGNSMGWYTALAVTGALDFDDGFRLVQTMALLQEEHQGGGQVLYPRIDDDWRPDPERARIVASALASSEGHAFRSIDLGGYAVLAGTDEGVAHLLRELPPVRLGSTSYPFRLIQHGPYHTPLLEGVSRRARESLADLEFRRPNATLVDGAGRRHTPWSADLGLLRDYTFGDQVVTPYDFTTSLAVALAEEGPEQLVLPGPGNTLGGVTGQVLIGAGWRGLRDRAGFEALQASDAPLVRSMRR